MRPILLLPLLLLFVVGACGGSSETSTPPAATPMLSPSQAEALVNESEPRISAKEAFSIAAPYALAGDPSAQLASIRLEEQHHPSKDGRGSKWSLLFCSSDTEDTVRLYVKGRELFLDSAAAMPAADKEPSEAWSYDAHDWEPVGEWVDSTEAIREALAHATQSKVFDMALGPRTWVFRFYDACNASATRVAVDASTGRFLAEDWSEWYSCR